MVAAVFLVYTTNLLVSPTMKFPSSTDK
uniref:Uncharacterized protein n=1 Tax=Anguilla anguilla TaxID=7936 RepID=A0A0E9UJ94_ANGAN